MLTTNPVSTNPEFLHENEGLQNDYLDLAETFNYVKKVNSEFMW